MSRLIWSEYKKNFCKKSFYAWMGILLFVIFQSLTKMFESKDILALKHKAIIGDVNLSCYILFQIVILASALNVLLEEFRYGTATFLLTGNRSRTQILLSKVLSTVLLGVTLGLVNYFFVVYCDLKLNLTHKYFSVLFGTISVYFIYTWFISNYFLFCSTVFNNRVSAFIAGTFFLYILSKGIDQLLNKITSSVSLSNKFLDLNPFITVLTLDSKTIKLFSYMHLSGFRVISVLMSGIVFFALSAFMFDKKDLA